MATDVVVHIRDRALSRVCQVDDFLRLDAVLRFNAPGSWLLEMPTRGAIQSGSTDAAAALLEDGGIVVERNGAVIFSGPVDTLTRRWNADEDVLVASGWDDLAFLSDRLAHPEPGTAAPPYATTAYDVRTGVAETVMRAYVAANAGATAITNRRIAGLSVPGTTGLGASVNGRARYGGLLDLLAEMALKGGDLGFRVIQVGATLEFQVYTPIDRRATAIFSAELGNLQSFEYTQRAPEANYIYAGGGGEGTARQIVEGSDSSSIVRFNRRIEAFRDRRDTTVTAELTQTVAEELANKSSRHELRLAPIDMDDLAFGAHYSLGDRVTVEIDGERIDDIVREVHLTYSAERDETVEPVIGTPGGAPSGLASIFSRQRATEKAVSNLERR